MGRVQGKIKEVCIMQFNEPNDKNLVFNMNEVETPEFEVLPAGWYDCEIKTCEATESKQGAPMLKLVYSVIEETDYKGRQLFDYFVLGIPDGLTGQKLEKAETASRIGRGKLKKLIEYAAIPIMDGTNFSFQAFADSGEAIGRTLRVKVGVGKYQGEPTNNVKDYKEAAVPAEGFGFL